MESPNKNKSELLEQLKIDRDSEPESQGISITQMIIIAIISAAVGATTTYFWLPSTKTDSNPIQPPTVHVTDTQQPQSTASKSSPSQSVTSQTSVSQTAAQQTSDSPTSILNASGYITARRMATVSAEIMGLIQEVKVEEGMQVSQGQVLAELDSTLAKVNLKFATAQIDALNARKNSAQASLEEAQRQYQRIIKNKYSSEAEKTQAQTDLDNASANLKSAVADINVAQIEVLRQQERLADHTIRAPFDGIVTVKNAQPGEIVSPSSAGGGFTRTGICTIVDMNSLEIEVDVNESFIGRVAPGQRVEAVLDAYADWTIPASVIAIIPTADRARATVKVRIKIETKDPRILPDMGVKVAFYKTD